MTFRSLGVTKFYKRSIVPSIVEGSISVVAVVPKAVWLLAAASVASLGIGFEIGLNL